jgi:RNA polymerase sigma factor (sigma-70 family)
MSGSTATTAARDLPSFTGCVRAFERELAYLTRCLRRHGVSAVDAEDLVQDVFVVMCRRWSDFRPERPVRPWLAGIAYHVAKSHLRRHGREVLRSDLDLEDGRPVAEDRLMAEGARTLVLKVLSSLPERHRAALVMHDLDEMAVPDVAQALGIPLASAYTRIRRARHAFAEELKRYEADASPSRTPGLQVEALFALEREPPPISSEIHKRAVARAGATAAEIARGSWPAGLSAQRPWTAPAQLRVTTQTGLAVAVAAGLAICALLAFQQRERPLAGADAEPFSKPAALNGGVDAASAMRGPRASRTLASVVPRLIVAQASPSARLAEGLTGYWRFDEQAGTRRAHDASPFGNSCTLHRPDLELGWIDAPASGGKSLGPDGWLHCRQAPVPPGTGAEVSAALWIRIDQPHRYHGTLVARHLLQRGGKLFHFAVRGTDLVLRSSAWQPDRLAVPLVNPVGRWMHVAFTRRSDGLTKLFVDGAVAGEQRAQALPASPATGPLLIGAAFDPHQVHRLIQRFHGAIDDVMVYDRALADDEVALIAAQIKPAGASDIGLVGAND